MKLNTRGNCIASLLVDITLVLIIQILMWFLGYFLGFDKAPMKMFAADAVSFSIQLFYAGAMVIAIVAMWFPKLSSVRYIISALTLTLLWATYGLARLDLFHLDAYGEISLATTAFIALFTVQTWLRDTIRKSEFLKEVMSELHD